MIQPLEIRSRLAGNPTQKPRFSAPIKSADGRTLEAVDPRATRALISLMDMNAVLGGAASHYGGPAAMAELMSALHAIMFDRADKEKKTWHDLFHFVNDAGHCENGLYALKANYGHAGLDFEALKKFRSIESNLTGHGESHLFPTGVYMSNGPLGSAFPQSQGLAIGDKLAGRDRVTVTVISDGACMEGEAKESFAAIPGLAAAGHLAPYVLIISDNNTKLTGRIDKDSFSMDPTFKSLATLGWKLVELQNGHDLQKCHDVIEQAIASARANPKQPVVIHARTIKGIGTKKTSESSSGGHGFPLKSPTELAAFLSEIYDGQKYPETFDTWIEQLKGLEAEIKAKAVKDTGEKIQKGVAAALIKGRRDGLPVLSVTSDLPGSTGLADFRKEFPECSIDVGVAESNMMSTAAGLAKLGFIPIVDTFAQFGVTKGALPLTMAMLSQAPMIAVFSHTGFQDAADGASHQSLGYLAMTSSIPEVETYALTCSEEAEQLMTQALNRFAADQKAGRTPKSVVFFLGRENFPKSFGAKSYELGRAQIVQESAPGKKTTVAIAAQGSMMGQAVEAARRLEEKGIGSIVINPSIMNHLDHATFKSVLDKTGGRLITVEDHQLIGGMGSYLAHQLTLNGISLKLKSLGVHGEFGRSAYNAIDLYRLHRMDAGAIVEAALAL